MSRLTAAAVMIAALIVSHIGIGLAIDGTVDLPATLGVAGIAAVTIAAWELLARPRCWR